MTANQCLLLFVIVFYSGLVVAVKVSNWRAGKLWSDGPSLIPIIPLFPAAALLVGWLVNLAAAPWGSWGVAVFHVGGLVAGLFVVSRRPAPKLAAAGPAVAARIEQVRTAFATAIGARVHRYSTAEIQHDDGTWEAWPDLPIRLEFDSGHVVSVSWSKFDELWIGTDPDMPFDAGGTTHRWVENAMPAVNDVLGAVIRSVWLGQGHMSIEQREIPIWTRLLVETTKGWLEIYNALDQNGYALHAERPTGRLVRCA